MRLTIILSSISLLLGAASATLAQDVNGNLAPDSKDLRLGTSLDCNHNGVPDEAEADRPHFSAAVEHLNALEQSMSNVFDACAIDFNLDGRPDLVSVSMPDPNFGYVTLWRNDGGVGLTYLTRITINNARPTYVRAADMNGDGKPDLVIGDSSFTKVYVFKGNGDSTFAAPITLTGDTSNNGLGGIAIGDLDNDGDLDIAATCWGAHTANYWKNNGNATFGAKTSVAVGFAPRGIAIGDLTGDGLADIATANSFEISAPAGANGTVTLLKNTGAAFANLTTITMPTNSGPFGVMRPRPQDIAICDVDHDGNRDLVVSSKDSQRLDLVTNLGAGSFAAAVQIDAGYYLGSVAGRVLCRDLDGDGWDDIAWCDTKAYSVSIYKNVGGSFAFRQSFGAGNNGSASVDAADFDDDGLPDLAVANNGARTFSILKNQGNLQFDAALRLRPSQYPASTVIADFTNDGITDLGFTDQSTTALLGFYVYPGLGDGTFGSGIHTSSFTQTGAITARDFNHDGNQDLFVTSNPSRVHLGNGDGTFQAPIINSFFASPINVMTDINGDGEFDVVWIVEGHPGTLMRSLGDGTGHFDAAVAVAVAPAEAQSIGFGDITGDGAPEIFTGHAQGTAQPGGILSIYPNNGDGTFGTRQDRYIVAAPLSPAVIAIACADFDVDGDNDVIIAAGGLKLFKNPGDGTLPNTGLQVDPQQGSILLVADIDQDNIPDLFVRGLVGAAFLNDGTGHFTRRIFMHSYDSNAHGMFIGDLNNDGRTDLLIEPENSWAKYVYLNLPSLSGDCDGDGLIDPCDPDICAGGNGPLGDLNGDDMVDANDLAMLLAAWGTCPAGQPCSADIDGDGQVNAADLAILLAGWAA